MLKQHCSWSCTDILSPVCNKKGLNYLYKSFPHLPVQDGLPGGPLLIDGTLLHLLHRHLVLPVQQLQASAHTQHNIIHSVYTHVDAHEIRGKCVLVSEGDSVCAGMCFSPVLIKDSHLSHKCGFSLLPERGAPPLPV